jgi:hypothetical protein
MSKSSILRAAQCTAAFGLVLAAGTPADATTIAAALKLDWSAANHARLQAEFPDAESVAQFVKEVVSRPDDYDHAKVNEYRFADLQGNGQLELVCTLNFGGAGWNHTLLVVSRKGARFVADTAESNGREIDDLSHRVADLNRDGRQELLVPTRLGDYRGARPTPEMIHIYKLVDARLYLADNEFPAFYGQREAELRRKLADLDHQAVARDAQTEALRQEQMAAYRQEIGEISKLTGR